LSVAADRSRLRAEYAAAASSTGEARLSGEYRRSTGSRSTARKLSQSKFDSLGQQWMVRTDCDGPTTARTRRDLYAIRHEPWKSRVESGPDRFERIATAKSLFRHPADLRRIGKRTGNGSSFGNSGFEHIDTQSYSATRHGTAWRISDFTNQPRAAFGRLDGA
jgi:hypothetical protein